MYIFEEIFYVRASAFSGIFLFFLIELWHWGKYHRDSALMFSSNS